jgi:hypothetical protein
MKKILPLLLVCIIVSCGHAQNMKVWNGKKCANEKDILVTTFTGGVEYIKEYQEK